MSPTATTHPPHDSSRDNARAPRLRVAMVAFGCSADKGSEQGAGWTWAWAAAQHHDVLLLTGDFNREEIEAERARRPDVSLQPIYVAHTELLGIPAMSDRFIRARYALWLVSAARTLERMRAHGASFDLGHHVTFSNDWFPAPFIRRDPPFVWGPVGGAPPLSLQALRWMGARGAAIEIARGAATEVGRRTVGRFTATRAQLVLAQNATVGARITKRTKVIVEPHIGLAVEDLRLARQGERPAEDRVPHLKTAVFAARLRAWKGGALAIAALARPEAADWRLQIFGQGGDMPRLQRLAERHGVTDRVDFLGARPREEVLKALATGDALLFPSLADAAGWIVAEAVALGCPVVCVDRGGPPTLIQSGGGVIVPLRGDVPAGLARALAGLDGRNAPDERWSQDRLPELIRRLYAETHAANAAGR